MLISKYSNPEFDPYENDDLVEVIDDGPWAAPTASGPIAAVMSLPGSKSLTNRELVLAALAEGPSTLRAPLHSRDTALMIQALKALGSTVEETTAGRFGADLLITPAELNGGTFIDCGLAGTLMRFLPPIAALALGPVGFDGDPSARKRPMRTMIMALRDLGVEVNDDGRGKLPFSLYGMGQVAGGELEVDASASSQFISGLLLAAAKFTNGLTLTHSGESLPSTPHIEMTIEALRARGVKVETPKPGKWMVAPGPIAGRDVDIEPDLSNAAPFLAAALVAGGTVTIEHWPATTTQVGESLVNLLPLFGATVTKTADGSLMVDGGVGFVNGGSIRGVELDLSYGGELAPALVALAALADSTSVITGIGHLRGHESNRLEALAAEINALGGKVTELDDGLQIEPMPLHAGLWHTHEDHRMATAGAIVGLAVADVQIEDIRTTTKTLPQFAELWRGSLLGVGVERGDPLNFL